MGGKKKSNCIRPTRISYNFNSQPFDAYRGADGELNRAIAASRATYDFDNDALSSGIAASLAVADEDFELARVLEETRILEESRRTVTAIGNEARFYQLASDNDTHLTSRFSGSSTHLRCASETAWSSAFASADEIECCDGTALNSTVAAASIDHRSGAISGNEELSRDISASKAAAHERVSLALVLEESRRLTATKPKKEIRCSEEFYSAGKVLHPCGPLAGLRKTKNRAACRGEEAALEFASRASEIAAEEEAALRQAMAESTAMADAAPKQASKKEHEIPEADENIEAGDGDEWLLLGEEEFEEIGALGDLAAGGWDYV